MEETMNKSDQTLQYYKENAESFTSNTIAADMSNARQMLFQEPAAVDIHCVGNTSAARWFEGPADEVTNN